MKAVTCLLAVVLSASAAVAAPHAKGAAANDVLQALADKDAIRQAMHLYAHGIDMKNFALTADQFTPDGCFEVESAKIKACGAEDLIATYNASTAGLQTQHNMGTETIDYTGTDETATATVYLAVYGQDSEQKKTLINGYYTDEWVRTQMGDLWPELRWQLKKRSFTVTVSRPAFEPRPVNCLGFSLVPQTDVARQISQDEREPSPSAAA